MARLFIDKFVTANDLREGDVVYLDDRKFGGSLCAQASGYRLSRTRKITQCCDASV